MERAVASRVLFDLFDHDVERYARAIRNQVLSEYRDVPFSADQRKALEPLIRAQLDEFVQSLLGIFDNVGGVIPDNPEGIIGYVIRSQHHEWNGESSEGPRIGDDNTDYADMWRSYLQDEHEGLP